MPKHLEKQRKVLPFPETHKTVQGSMSKAPDGKKPADKSSMVHARKVYPGADNNTEFTKVSKAPSGTEVDSALFGKLAGDNRLQRDFG